MDLHVDFNYVSEFTSCYIKNANVSSLGGGDVSICQPYGLTG